MTYKPGSPKPEKSGRKKGTPNRKTQLLEEILSAQGVSPVNEILKMLPALDPKQQVDVYLELLGYLFPKRKAMEMHLESRSPLANVKITDELMLQMIGIAREAKDSPPSNDD